tara:strand:+ start:108 stop:566 length:459 start_codon:yes stop_codon:yes gene_type:complete
MKYISIIFTLLLLSCGNSKETVGVDDSQDIKTSTQEEMYCADIIEAAELPDTLEMATTYILSYKEVDGCVCIKYQYSGCKKGGALLSYDGEFQEDTRPKVKMKLGVMNAGYCDQLLTDSTCFSMKKMGLIGHEVLIYLNEEKNNLLIRSNLD